MPDPTPQEQEDGAMEFYWLAETDDQSHRYAVRGKPGQPLHLTTDAEAATRFPTRDAALEFCCGTAATAMLEKLVPQEHGFGAKADAIRRGDE